MSSIALPLEPRLLLELARGAALAVHAAAGSARGHRAARLLRAAEGLCRSAAALLQLPDDAKTSEGQAQGTTTKKGKPKEKAPPTPAKDDARKKPGARQRRRRRAPASSLPTVPEGDVDFDDAWADKATVPPAPLLEPPATAAAAKRRRSAPACPPASKALAERLPTPPRLPNTETGWGKPFCRRITDRPVSACGSLRSAAAASAELPLALRAGGYAYATGLQGRPELNDEVYQLESFDPSAGRWVCEKGDGVKLLLRPSNLVLVPDD